MEKRRKKFHRAIQGQILKGPDKERQQDMPSHKTQLSIETSHLTEAITEISLLMEDANRAKKQDSLAKLKEKEETEWNKLPELLQVVILGLQARYVDDMDEDTMEDIVIPDRPSKK